MEIRPLKIIYSIILMVILSSCRSAPMVDPAGGHLHAATPIATFSIVAYDAKTGDLGVAVQSKFFGVGAVVPFAQAGVGAIATQALGNTQYGPKGLSLLKSGASAEDVVRILTSADPGSKYRQLGVVDAKGGSDAFTGRKAQDWKGHVIGKGYTCQGNILAGEAVVKAMASAFEKSKDKPLAERMVEALRGGQSKGGDKRGMQSAALIVVRKRGGYGAFNDRYIDLRVDDHKDPIEELARLLELHRKTWRNVPVPGASRGRVVVEKRVEGNPRDVFVKSLELFKKKEWKSIYELCIPEFRKKKPFDKFKKKQAADYEKVIRYLDDLKYVETEYVSDTETTVFYRHVGTLRNYPQKVKLVEGKWLLVDF